MKKKKRHYNLVFTTRKDFAYLFMLIILIIAFCYYALVFLFFYKYLELIISLMFVTIFLTLILKNEIVLEKYYIRVYYGIFTYKIKYSDIRDIYISDNHYSSLASSYHKVGIKTSRYKSKIFDTFVSPMDRDDFIYEVNRRR